MTTATAPITASDALERAQSDYPQDLVGRVEFLRQQLDLCEPEDRPAWDAALKTTRDGTPLEGPWPLTKQDVAAIRKADEIDGHLDKHGRYWIHCIKRATLAERERDPYVRDQTIKIQVGGGVTSYEKYEAPLVAYGNIARRYDDGGAIKVLVRGGDRVRLLWVRGNNCEYLTKAGLTRDELHIEIVRAGDKDGRRPIRLLCDVRTTPDNSARMTHTAGRF